MSPKNPSQPKTVETVTHADASRKNIPTAEYPSVGNWHKHLLVRRRGVAR